MIMVITIIIFMIIIEIVNSSKVIVHKYLQETSDNLSR